MVLVDKFRALTLLSLLVSINVSLGLEVEAEFNQRGVRGNVLFSQSGTDSATSITVNLTGLSQHSDTSFLWHVHEYPFPLNSLGGPCGSTQTGGHYDPLAANINPNYTESCARNQNSCELGDLSGKFGPLNNSETTVTYSDPSLSLFGVYSIIGRSLVVHLSNGTRLVCANIGYPGDGPTDILYSPFRSSFTGEIFFREHTHNTTASVHTDLFRLSGNSNSQGHNWHVHENPTDITGTNCSVPGPHYNPYGVDTGPGYSDRCNSTSHDRCEVGDLSNKGAPFQVRERRVKQFYTDTLLPLLGETIFIDNRSVVIHDENRTAPRIACANVTRFLPLEGVVRFNESGLSGNITFSQLSPYDQTSVLVSFRGLQRMAGGYSIHVNPVTPEGSDSERCAAAGGRFNPLGISNEPNSTSQLTSDQYELGDLSGRFGSLAGVDEFQEEYSDPNLPLFGRYGIVGRSVVVYHQGNGSPWICSNIEHVRPVVRVVGLVNMTSYRGRITFTQPASDPFAETTIVVELELLQEIVVPQVTTTLTTPTNRIISATSTSLLMATPSPSLPTSLLPSFQTSRPQSTPTSTVPGLGLGSGNGIADMSPHESATVTGAIVTPSPSPIGGMRKKRSHRRSRNPRKRMRRQGPGEVGFDWSVRTTSTPGQLMDCNVLPVYESHPSNPSLCSPTNPLACTSGDLTSKHGPLSLPRQPGSITMVFTDPALPLSGPESLLTQGGVILIQPMGGDSSDNTVSCNPITLIDETTPTFVVTTPTEDVTTQEISETTPLADAVVIGAAVGGALAGLLLVAIIIALCVCCTRRRSKYNISNKSQLELGTMRPLKPILGVPNYRAVHNYSPQNEDDMQLVKGDWVTLIETPLGGDWWRGSMEGRGEGWFPRSYVEYVDVEAERKKQQEENFLMAASAIVAASSSFSATHPSLTKTRYIETASPDHERPNGGKPTKRANTFSRKSAEMIDLVHRSQTFRRNDIDSTPRAVRKLDAPYLADANNSEAMVVTNVGDNSSVTGSSRPDTPTGQGTAEFFTNKMAVEGSSQETEASNITESQTAQTSEQLNTNLLHTEKLIARFDFSGSTDIELQFKKGAEISVVERSDGGWWKGVCEGRLGWFPGSYVRPVPMEAMEERVAAVSGVNQQTPGNMEQMMSSGDDLEAIEYHALYPFNSDTESDLVFSEGDTVWVYWAQDNGWWFGAAGSAQGWFPGSYVEPVVNLSEAGSMSAVNQSGPQDKPAGSSLASQIAAAFKKKKPSETDLSSEKPSRSSFKKRWSMKRKSQDKGNETVSLVEEHEVKTSQETEPVEGSESTHESPGELQGQILAVLERRNSLGRNRHLTIDEQIASGKRRLTETQPHKSRTEMVADFMRRSFKRNKAPSAEAVSEKTQGEVTTAISKENAASGSSATNQIVISNENTANETPETKQKYRRESKARRAPPPPPAPVTAAAQSSPPVEPVQLISSSSHTDPKVQNTPTSTEPAVGPTSQPDSSQPDPKTPTHTEPVTATIPETPPQHAVENVETKVSRSFTTTQHRPLQPTARPRARKRRTTASSLSRDVVPRRQPPPPPPGTVKAKPKPQLSSPVRPPPDQSNNVRVNNNVNETAQTDTPRQRPAPPPRSSVPVPVRPRVQRVKRPVSRMIPPPPNIPLPPPPVKKRRDTRDEQTPDKSVVDSRSSNIPKPPVMPKPSRLKSSTSIDLETPPPTDVADSNPNQTASASKNTPKPPPPARTSSLGSKPVPTKRKLPSVSDLQSIEDVEEEVDSPPHVADSLQNRKASKSAPPKRPPPPRPASIASNYQLKLDVDPKRTTNKREKYSQMEAAPLAGSSCGTVLYDASRDEPSDRDETTPVLKARGNSLMQSLKKMVGRDSRRSSDTGKDKSHGKTKERAPTEEPSLPPPRIPSTEKPQMEPVSIAKESVPDQNGSPLTKPHSVSESEQAETEKGPSNESPPTGKPARPPPPKTPPTVPKENHIPSKPLPQNTPTSENEQSGALPPTEPSNTVNKVTSETETRPVPTPRSSTPVRLGDKSHDVEEGSHDSDKRRERASSPETSFYHATEDYEAQNSEQLSFSTGDVLIIIEKRGDGFNFGMLDDGTTGLFPVSHVEPFFH